MTENDSKCVMTLEEALEKIDETYGKDMVASIKLLDRNCVVGEEEYWKILNDHFSRLFDELGLKNVGAIFKTYYHSHKKQTL